MGLKKVGLTALTQQQRRGRQHAWTTKAVIKVKVKWDLTMTFRWLVVKCDIAFTLESTLGTTTKSNLVKYAGRLASPCC